MSHPIPVDIERLAAWLRQAADEIESAARYGVPVPTTLNFHSHEYGTVSFSATEHEFAAWAEYADAVTEDYEHEGVHWSSATAIVNGLPLRFAVRRDVEVPA